MKDLTTGNERDLIIEFAWPMLLGNVFQNFYNIVDSIIVGNYVGKEALAAVGASFPIIFAFISLIIGVGSGTSIVISQYFGAKQNENVRKAVDTLFIFFIFASILISLVGIPFSKDVFLLMQLPQELIPQAVDYIQIYLSGIFVFFGFAGISSVLRGIGDSRTPLRFMIVSTLANIIFDYIFVVYFHWGVKGVAFATILAQGGAFLSAIVYLQKRHELIKLIKVKWVFDWDIFKKCVRIGLPTGLQQSFVAVGMMVMMSIINGFGTNTVAAYAVATRIDSFAKMPSMNFASALSAFVGQNLGAKKEDRARKGTIQTFLISGIYSVIITIIIVFCGEHLMGLFTNDVDVIRIGKEYLIIVSSFYLAFSAMFTVIGMLRGAGDTIIPMFITLINLWIIRIPLSFWLVEHLGEKGIWWSFPISWIVGAISAYLYYRTDRWKGKTVLDQ